MAVDIEQRGSYRRLQRTVLDRLLAMKGRALALFAFLVVAWPCVGSSSKLLGIPYPHGASHYFNILKILDELGERGHDVAILAPSDVLEWPRKSAHERIRFIFYDDVGNTPLLKQNVRDNDYEIEAILQYGVSATGMILKNASILSAIRSFVPDLAILDASFSPSVLIAEFLGLPAMGVWPVAPIEPFLEMYLFPPSLAFVSQFRAGLEPYARWSFIDRLKNLVAYTRLSLILGRIDRSVQSLVTEYKLPSFHRQLQDVLMVLVTSDFAIESPVLTPPHVKYVGALLPEPPKPLPPNLEEFVTGADELGVVLVSFGTVVHLSSSGLLNGIADVLKRLPFRVIWRLTEERKALNLSELEPNILVLDWVPQNDLLGHRNVKAIVTHGGHNTVTEAAYHGVPIVAVPFFGDQFDSARRAVHRGFGLIVQRGKDFEAALLQAILRVMNEADFATKAQKVSRRLRRHKRHPVEIAGDWVEHILATEKDQYLAPNIGHLSWFELRMLDCYAFVGCCLAVVLIVVVFGIRLSVKWLYVLFSKGRYVKLCRGPHGKKKN